MIRVRFLLLVIGLSVCGYAYTEQVHLPRNAAQNNSRANSVNSHSYASDIAATEHVSQSRINVPETNSPIDTCGAKCGTKAEKNWLERFLEDPIAIFTGLLFVVTTFLWLATRELVIDAKETSKRQARAFIFLDGFNVELTTAKDALTPTELLPEEYRQKPEFFITRFAVQPRWKNSGNTPVKRMSVSVNWRGPEGTIPPDFAFRVNSEAKLFLAPNAIEPSEYIEIPSVRSLISWGLNPLDIEPLVFIWGRADYEDIFGKQHFVQWCYRIRLDDHKGEGKIRANFIQWGDFNRSDEDKLS